MVGFMREHVTQHFQANRPGSSPAVSLKLLDAASITKPFSKHLCAASSAPGQCRTGLPRRTVSAVELRWNFEVRSRKPDPLGADIVHVGEDRCNGASLAGRFGSPSLRVKVFDKKLIHAIIGGKNPDRSSGELSLGFVLRRGHGSVLPGLMIFRTVGNEETNAMLVVGAMVPCRQSWFLGCA
jgi:hypothetical protein